MTTRTARDVKQCHPVYLYDADDESNLLDVCNGAPDGYVDDVCYQLIRCLQSVYNNSINEFDNARLLEIVERMPIFQDKRICLDVNDDG